MVDKELLSRKSSQLREYLVALRNAKDITWNKYEEDIRARAFVERYLQLCIEKLLILLDDLPFQGEQRREIVS